MALGFGVFTLAVSALFLRTRTMLGESRQLGKNIDNVLVPSIGALEDLDRSIGESRVRIKHWLTVQSRTDDPEKSGLVELIDQTIPSQYSILKSMEFAWDENATIQLDSLQRDLDYLFIAYHEIMRLLPDFSSYDDPIAMMDAEYYALEGSSLPLFTQRIRDRLDKLTESQNSSLLSIHRSNGATWRRSEYLRGLSCAFGFNSRNHCGAGSNTFHTRASQAVETCCIVYGAREGA